ncbi:MAG: LytTR family DNA-binding domain-containing protein [Oscillospiraceae bacterium]|nr:LytTR family DNA-binding domain-containing protein [Oscillospiraceae bacterium]
MLVAVCDDRKPVLEQVITQVKAIPFIKNVTSYNNIQKLITDIACGILYDVILMDIEWGLQENGIDFAEKIYIISSQIKFIFITGFPTQYSQLIFLGKINLCGFLAKPIDQKLLIEILRKAKDELEKANEKMLTVSFNGLITTFAPHYIFYIESKGHTATIYTTEGEQRCYERLEALKKRLPECFIYSHKSYLVNMNQIKRIERDKLILINDMIIPISKARYTELKKNYFRYISENV